MEGDRRTAASIPTAQPTRRAIAVDFDGVLHAYTSAWRIDEHGHGAIDDPPVLGAIAWLEQMVEHFDVWIFTCRMLDPRRSHVEQRIRDWLLVHGLSPIALARLLFTHEKPHADVYIDDRGFRFEGRFPTVAELAELRTPWNKRGTL